MTAAWAAMASFIVVWWVQTKIEAAWQEAIALAASLISGELPFTEPFICEKRNARRDSPRLKARRAVCVSVRRVALSWPIARESLGLIP